MNDLEMNRLIESQNMKTISPRAVSTSGANMKTIKLDSHTFKAKKQIKGVHWLSNLNNTNDEVEKFLNEKLHELNFSSEYYNHFMSDIEMFINFGFSNNLITKNDELLFLSSTTDSLLQARKNNQEVPLTPGLLLIDFTTAVADISKQIKSANDSVKELLYQQNLNIDFTKVTDRWSIDTARRMQILTKEQDDEIAKLYDRKSRIMAYYKGQADTFKAGNSPLADAFAFALLWREVMYSQSKRAKRQDDEAYENMLVEFQLTTGINPRHDPSLLKRLRDRTVKYSYTKLSSVINLFPTGVLQFLDLMENKRITQYVKVPQNVTGFFVHEEMTPDKLIEAKSLEGSLVLLKDSQILNSGFQLATEDFSQEGYIKSSPRSKMVSENYPNDYIESVCSKNYYRGGKAFLGGYQLARVVFVETSRPNGQPYKGGIRFWLQDVKAISEDELYKMIQNK